MNKCFQRVPPREPPRVAWEQQKSCMVCDEVCPYKAVESRKEPGNPVPIPQVREEKWAGCGYCEHFCPVQNQSAKVVTPMGALRMSKGSYIAQGKSQGLNRSISPKSEYGPQPEGKDWGKGFAPGFEDDESGSDLLGIVEIRQLGPDIAITNYMVKIMR